MFYTQQPYTTQNLKIESLNELSEPQEGYWKFEERIIDKVSKQMQQLQKSPIANQNEKHYIDYEKFGLENALNVRKFYTQKNETENFKVKEDSPSKTKE